MDKQLKGLFGALIKDFGGKQNITPKRNSIPKLVIGVNQVDNLASPDAPWVSEINLPSEKLRKIIEGRVADIKDKLSKSGASKDQIEYFSALRAYRLPAVINAIVNNCKVMTTSFKPKDITDPSIAPEMSERTRKILEAKMAMDREKYQKHGMDEFVARLMSQLDPIEAKKFAQALKDQKEKPIKVAVLGQSGVGKSSTVNNLFGAKLATSRIAEGTNEENYKGYKDYELPDGSTITVADLPGYGRDASKDEAYKKLYIDALKDVDIILLIVQANDKAIKGDQEMIECLYEWSKEGLI